MKTAETSPLRQLDLTRNPMKPTRRLFSALAAMSALAHSSPPNEAQAAGYANIYQGNVIAGGSLSISNYRSPTTSLTTLIINPSLEYFILDGFALGGQVAWTHDFDQ